MIRLLSNYWRYIIHLHLNFYSFSPSFQVLPRLPKPKEMSLLLLVFRPCIIVEYGIVIVQCGYRPVSLKCLGKLTFEEEQMWRESRREDSTSENAFLACSRPPLVRSRCSIQLHSTELFWTGLDVLTYALCCHRLSLSLFLFHRVMFYCICGQMAQATLILTTVAKEPQGNLTMIGFAYAFGITVSCSSESREIGK